MALTHLEASKFRIMYESASQGEKKVLYSLHQLGKPATFSEILKKAKENGLKEGTTRKLLQRLHKDKEILKQLPNQTLHGMAGSLNSRFFTMEQLR